MVAMQVRGVLASTALRLQVKVADKISAILRSAFVACIVMLKYHQSDGTPFRVGRTLL